MVTKSKSSPRTRTHSCLQKIKLDRHEVILERLSLITLGNGHPEDGLLFMVRAFLDKHKDDEEDIKDIKAELKGVNENHNVLLGEITRVATDLSEFKAVATAIQINKKDIEEKTTIAENLKLTKSRDTWYKIFTIIGIAIAIFFGVKNSNKTDQVITTTESTKKEVENQGVPFVMDSRGNFVALPDSTIIKRFGNDTLQYFIIKSTK